MSAKLSWGIEGSFVTERLLGLFYSPDPDLASIVSLGLECLKTDQLDWVTRFDMVIDILLGKKIITGNTLEGTYGVEEAESRDWPYSMNKLYKKRSEWLDWYRDLVHKRYYFYADRSQDELLENSQDFLKTASLKPDKYAYGWVDTSGNFTKVAFGDHQMWAFETIKSKGWLLRYSEWAEEYRKSGKTDSPLSLYGDFLVDSANYVQLTNPQRGLAVPVYKNLSRLTKAQKETLFDFFYERGAVSTAEKFLED